MSEHNTAEFPKELTLKYEKAIAKNVGQLMQGAGLSQTQLCVNLKAMGMNIGQGPLSLMLSGERRMPLSLVVYLCEYFKVSLADLVDENFGRSTGAGSNGRIPPVYSEDLLNMVPYLGENLLVNPADPHFFGYLQTYYVYFFPSQGDDIRLRTGTLRLQAKGPVCEAILQINTNKLRDGKPYIKVYHGRCIISTTMRSVFVLLTDQEKGELSVLNFRYHNLSTYQLDCRMACMLLNATGYEHPPVVQRMFLSRTEICQDHLPLLIPHLHLNSGLIQLQKQNLETLRNMCPEYQGVVDELIRTNPLIPVYRLDEDDVLSTARRYLSEDGTPLRNPEDPAVNRFLAQLRSLSDQNRFNKVSRQADHLSHRLLRSLGYYHDHDEEN